RQGSRVCIFLACLVAPPPGFTLFPYTTLFRSQVLGAVSRSVDPAGNVALSGAADALRARLIDMLGDRYFQLYRRGSSANEAIFTDRKSTRLNSSHVEISYAVFCLKKKDCSGPR